MMTTALAHQSFLKDKLVKQYILLQSPYYFCTSRAAILDKNVHFVQNVKINVLQK